MSHQQPLYGNKFLLDLYIRFLLLLFLGLIKTRQATEGMEHSPFWF